MPDLGRPIPAAGSRNFALGSASGKGGSRGRSRMRIWEETVRAETLGPGRGAAAAGGAASRGPGTTTCQDGDANAQDPCSLFWDPSLVCCCFSSFPFLVLFSLSLGLPPYQIRLLWLIFVFFLLLSLQPPFLGKDFSMFAAYLYTSPS